MGYDDQKFAIPRESKDYATRSEIALTKIAAIIKDAIVRKQNRIVINTNLKLGLPMENINKVAGPFVEAWAAETFQNVADDRNNPYTLVSIEAKERLYMADVVLQFQPLQNGGPMISPEIDVKATAADIESSGKGPNITSFDRIRTAYLQNPDYMFVILSLKHKVYCTKSEQSCMMDGVMEVVSYNVYDLKYLSSKDLNYNPALGSGQIQLRDIHHVTLEKRTTWEFCQMLDRKYLGSSRRSLEQWTALAKKGGWITE